MNRPMVVALALAIACRGAPPGSAEGQDITRLVDSLRPSVERATGLDDYAATPGNLGYQMITRDLGDGTTEVATMSWWDSMDAIRGFAGDRPELARYYPEDDRFLVERPEFVDHAEVEAANVKVEA